LKVQARNYPMPDSKSAHNVVDDLAEEFANRWRSGERPSIEEYAQRFPDHADEIRNVLQGVVLMEQMKPRVGQSTATNGTASSPQPRPERIGEYRIIREIGRGGMGVVYEAEQETLHRRVAVKVLPANLQTNEKVRSRFRQEALAAARLHHTSIVPVFGVGEADGHCFYVMQLIDGRSLDQVIRSQGAGVRNQESGVRGSQVRSQGSATEVLGPKAKSPHETPESCSASPDSYPLTPNSCPLTPDSCPLTPRSVARIGMEVADALAYAHAQGVLHRDIKPSNLILDQRGAAWVTDFGVAKIAEGAGITQTGDVVGTLKYMPPERFSGQSDVRGDVYSLGMSLYEALTLQSPFPDTTPHHLIQLITHKPTWRPRKLNSTIPRDLETIVLKALACEPAQRYQSAGDMADDLRRFLDDRPILAKRAGLAGQAWRWCRRNPALAAATATVFLLLAGIAAVALVAYATTAAAHHGTTAALAAEKSEREHAEHTSGLALEALNRIYDRFAPTRLVVTPSTTSDEGVELPPQPAALPPEAIPLLEDLLRTYEEIAQASGSFPKLQAQAAEANHRIGDIRRRLGQYEDATSAYQAAIELYSRLLPDSDNDAVRIKLARAYNEEGRTLRTLHKLDPARQMHENAIGVLEEGSREFAGRPESRFELACSYYTLGQRDMFPGPERLGPPGGPLGKGPRGGPAARGPGGGDRRGRPDGPPGPGRDPVADSATRRAFELLEQLVREFPTVPEYRHLLACCYRDMPPERPGPVREPMNRIDRAVELLRQLVADFPQVPDYRFDLCETLGRRGPPPPPGDVSADARHRERVEEAIKLSAEMLAQYPNVPDYRAAHARYLDQLGMSLLRARRPDEAEKQHRKAVEIQKKLVAQYPAVVSYSLWLGLMERSLGQALGERGELKEARSLLEGAVERVEALWKKETRLGGIRPFLGMAYRDLGLVLARSNEPALAAEARRKAEEFGPPGPMERGGPRP
jgi:serine/threonine protein kinase